MGATTSRQVAKCPLCLKLLPRRNTVKLKCSHMLCSSCALQLQANYFGRCPICGHPDCSLRHEIIYHNTKRLYPSVNYLMADTERLIVEMSALSRQLEVYIRDLDRNVGGVVWHRYELSDAPILDSE